ncbi:MAG: hypothetical protein ACRERD_19050 [Candidatus Binatia bacterium]
MDNHRFDSLVKRLSAQTSRREGLRVLLASLAAGAAGFTTPPLAAACRRRGELCEKDAHCCSGGCGNIRKRRFKTKKGKVRHKRAGKCACSLTQEPCKIAEDCCSEGDACGPNDCVEGSVCCTAIGFPCTDDCDCCFDAFCCEECGGVCERKDCQETQEPCETADECCFEDDVCDFVDEDCPAGEGKACCVPAGKECEEDCDCCFPLLCDADLGECVAPSSTCLPDQVTCAPGKKKPCCNEAFPHCCDPGSIGGCCAVGFPVCCDHENPPGVACCPKDFTCCEPGDKQLCCPEDQVCCPTGSDLACASNLEACDDV